MTLERRHSVALRVHGSKVTFTKLSGVLMGPAGTAVERAFRAAGLIWAPAWLLNIVSALAGHQPVSRWPLATAALVASSFVAWLLLLVRRISSLSFIVAMLAGSSAQLALVDVRHLAGNYLYLSGLINSVVVLAGLLIPARAARMVAMSLVAWAVGWLALNAFAAGLMSSLWRQLVIAGYYAIVDSMVVSYATSVLRSGAAEADEEARTTSDFVKAATRRRAILEEHQRIGSLLHDTVINTLGAIRRGVLPASLEQVRARCRMDLARMNRFEFGAEAGEAVSLDTLAGEAAATADSLGLRAQIEPVSPATLPSDVAGVVLGAVTELLLNVSKHVDDERVEVRFGLQSEPVELVVAVRDFGRGWDGSGEVRGFAQSVARRVHGIGGRYEVLPAPTRGTWVSITVPVDRPASASKPVPPALGIRMPAAVRRAVWVCGAWWASLGALQSALAWRQPAFRGSVVALGVLLVALVAAHTSTRRRRTLSSAAQWLLVVPAAAVVALPQAGMVGCGITQPGAWGPDGAVGLIMAMVLLGRGRIPAVASSLAMAAGLAFPLAVHAASTADCGGALLTTLFIEIGTVLAVHLFRSKSEGLLATSEREWEAALSAAADEATSSYRGRGIAARLDLVSKRAGDLLRGIADGNEDPLAEQTRQAAGAYEQALRGMLVLDPALDELGEIVADRLVDAAAAGRTIRVLGADVVAPPPPGCADEVRALLAAVADAPNPATTAHISISGDGGLATLSVVTSWDLLIPTPRTPADGSFAISSENLEGETLVTVTWRVS